MIPKNFVRKLWWDGRMGHSTYLMFLLTFVNFILITHNYLIEGSQIFEKLISDMWLFIVVFAILYFPSSTLIGWWHRKTQISVEMTMKMLEDPITAKMIRTLLDVQTGKASKEEIDQFRKMLSNIEKNDIHEF